MPYEERRVLLVEDNAHDAALEMEALADCQIADRTDVARDGEEALDYLFCRGRFGTRPPVNPAVILLDLKLPKLGGLEVLRRVRSDEHLKRIPVVILTSSQDDRDVATSYGLGSNAFVVKPVDFCGFLEAVRTVGRFWAAVNEPPPPEP